MKLFVLLMTMSMGANAFIFESYELNTTSSQRDENGEIYAAADGYIEGSLVTLPTFDPQLEFSSAHKSLTDMNDKLISGDFNLIIREK